MIDTRHRKFIAVHCPECNFSNGGYYEGDITPTRPMSFVCKRDRFWDEKDKQMYASPGHCGAKWDIVITQEEYEAFFKRYGKEIIVKELVESINDEKA